MKPSLFAQYTKERTGRGILETEDGFATFEYVDEEMVYIVDLYVVPKKRNAHVASLLANTICEQAKKDGRTKLLGSVDTTAKGAEASIKVLKAYGMTLYKDAQPMLYFIKEIGE